LSHVLISWENIARSKISKQGDKESSQNPKSHPAQDLHVAF